MQRGEFFTELDCRYRQPGEPGEESEIDSIALLKPLIGSCGSFALIYITVSVAA